MESVLAFEEEQRELEQPETSSELQSSYGLKLVPWMSWDEWLFVYESLFSHSQDAVASAFERISTWRSRGCLPVTVDITASIIEIQQNDPYFCCRKGQAIAAPEENGASQCVNISLSDEMLAMLYSMAILRLVNGVIEKTRKKQEVSIAVAASAIGMPRMLIDIRHEGSHRELPALQIVRSASTMALDWLKSYYWEPQKKAIPFQGDSTTKIRKEIKSKLHELASCLKAKESPQPSSTPLKGKRNKKQITKILKNLVWLFSSCPSEVVSTLLDLLLKALSSSKSMESSVDAETGCSTDTLLDEWKLAIKKFSKKEPELLTAVLKEVLNTIEIHENMKNEAGREHLLSENGPEVRQVVNLASLFSWLVQILKELKPRRRKDSAAETKMVLAESTVSKAALMQLLRKSLALSARGNKWLMDSGVCIAQLIGHDHLTKKLNKLSSVLPSNSEMIECNSSLVNSKSVLIQQDESISQAAKKLELIKHLRMKRKVAKSTDNDMGNSRRWIVATSWNPCPIGMLPNSARSSGCVPVLDFKDDQKKIPETCQARENLELNYDGKMVRPTPTDDSGVKKRRLTIEGDFVSIRGDNVSISGGLDGQLMIGGVWKRIGEEDILAIKSSVRILV